MEPFGEQLKKARNRVKMSQDTLSARSKVSKYAIQSLEKGTSKQPDISTLVKIMWNLRGSTFEFEYGGKRFVMRQEGLVEKAEP